MQHVTDLPLNRCKRNCQITCDITVKIGCTMCCLVYADLNTVVMETHQVTADSISLMLAWTLAVCLPTRHYLLHYYTRQTCF